MQQSDSVVAILIADIHLALNPPACRRDEPNWFEAMTRSLDEVRGLAILHEAPILCAGDVFDRWNSSPELINFALSTLPNMYSIPGQHDLPLHRYEDMHRSAYGTLVKAGKLTTLHPGRVQLVKNAVIQGFPWGTPLTPCDIPPSMGKGRLKIALVHSFLWLDKDSGYPGAPETGRVHANRDSFAGWDVVVFGDNHKGFYTVVGDTSVLNCGTVFRRRTDEVGYSPHVGLLKRSGEIELYFLETEKDVLVVLEDPETWNPEDKLADFVSSLNTLGGDPLDFRAAMGRVIKSCDTAIGEILREVMV